MKSIAELAKEMSQDKENLNEADINKHVSSVLDEHLEMISAAHRSTHDSDHDSSISLQEIG